MTTAPPWSLYGQPSPVDMLAAEVAELRPLPESTLRIAGLTTDDRFSAQELAALIADDPAVTARLLRLANSAYYGFPRQISTVRDAVVLVGLRAVRAVVLVACVMDASAVRPARPSIDARAAWRFSVAVGVIAQLLAVEAKVEPEAAFTAGVLHAIGLVALDQYRPEQMRVAMHEIGTGRQPPDVVLRTVFGFSHPELGAALATRWSFPHDLVAAIRDQAPALDELPDERSLAQCVRRARLIAHACGLPDGLTPVADDGAEPPAMPVRFVAQIDRAGGIAGVLRRADAFVEATMR